MFVFRTEEELATRKQGRKQDIVLQEVNRQASYRTTSLGGTSTPRSHC